MMFPRLIPIILSVALSAGSFPAAGQSAFPDWDSAPNPVSETEVSTSDMLSFPFYGMQFQLPAIRMDLPHSVGTRNEYSNLIDRMKRAKAAQKFIPYLRDLASSLGFNDYLTYDLLSHYVDALLPDSHNSVRAALKQHIMDRMGYLARLGFNPMGDGIVLLAFAQPVYSMKLIPIDGFRYYAFAGNDVDLSDPVNADIKPVKLVSDSHRGMPLNLRLGKLSLPESPRHFEFSDGTLTISGNVNANLRDMLYRYPRTNLDDIGHSEIDPALRRSIVDQLKTQLAGKSQKEAVNTLLAFIQNAFPYMTDEDLHGFEKPYFPEEMFLHEASDCEDRSMLYSYLLREVLGVPSVIIGYSDHVCVAVHLDQSNVRGSKITVDDKDYYISDPTFKGARTGRCMPQYVNETPEVYFKN